MKQQTLSQPFTVQGIGTHSGQPATMTVYPAPIDTGFVFVRSDQQEDPIISAKWDNVHSTLMSTQIKNQSGASIATIEHILAALWGSGITNARIEVNGPEIPIMDGSSLPFVEKLNVAGKIDQESFLKTLKILEPVEVKSDYGWARFEPADVFSLSMSFSFGPRWPNHSYQLEYTLTPSSFMTQIAPARTFGFFEDAEALWAKGLAKGSSLENVVVIKEGKILNEEGLRFDDEFVRHKILDAIGDFALAGYAIKGKFVGSNSGHGMNSQLLKALFQNPQSFSIEK